MNSLRHSIALLESLLTVYPCQATEGNMELLRQAKVDVEHYARLKVLQGMVSETCVGDAWEETMERFGMPKGDTVSVKEEDNEINRGLQSIGQ